MNRVIPRYVPISTIEDQFGYLITAETQDKNRVYLARGLSEWAGIGEAMFFSEALDAADAMKEAIGASVGLKLIDFNTIKLVRTMGFLIPTAISENELKKRRREAVLARLSPDEIEALGLNDSEKIDRPPYRPVAAYHETAAIDLPPPLQLDS